jgi:hypothetical protein
MVSVIVFLLVAIGWGVSLSRCVGLRHEVILPDGFAEWRVLFLYDGLVVLDYADGATPDSPGWSPVFHPVQGSGTSLFEADALATGASTLGVYRRRFTVGNQILGGRDFHYGRTGIRLTWLLLPAAGLTLLSYRRLRYHLRRRGWIREGFCPRCGYDWRATPGRCSECGLGQERAASSPRAADGPFR